MSLKESKHELRSSPITAGKMTEQNLRCGADGCHFCCCCTRKYERLGCLRHQIVWHIQNWFTTSLPPRNTILLLDELKEWEDKQDDHLEL